MAYQNISRTASMAVSKKNLHGPRGGKLQGNPSSAGRRYTMVTQTRDSVLSNGSSDRSSSVSDEAFLSHPVHPEHGGYANGFFRYNDNNINKHLEM